MVCESLLSVVPADNKFLSGHKKSTGTLGGQQVKKSIGRFPPKLEDKQIT